MPIVRYIKPPTIKGMMKDTAIILKNIFGTFDFSIISATTDIKNIARNIKKKIVEMSNAK